MSLTRDAPNPDNPKVICPMARNSFLGASGLAAALALIGGVDSARAQVVTNPRVIEFEASADHSVRFDDGREKVDRYEVEFYDRGAAEPFQVVNVGKPPPGSDGMVRLPLGSIFAAWPVSFYEARVAAAGPSGRSRSDPSNPFTVGAPQPPSFCTIPVGGPSVEVDPNGAAGRVQAVGSPGCILAAMSDVPWLRVGVTNVPDGPWLDYQIDPNTSGAVRQGTVRIGDQNVTVRQRARDVSLRVQTTGAPGVVGVGGRVMDCGTACESQHSAGAQVALWPVPLAGSVFLGWSGHPDCADGRVTLETTRECTAAFEHQEAGAFLDFDGDQRGDVLLYDVFTGAFLLGHWRDGRGFDEWRSGAWPAGQIVAVADFEGNAVADVVLYDPGSGAWRRATDDPDRSSLEPHQAPAGANLHVLDVDQDGRSDVIFHSPVTGEWMTCRAEANGDACVTGSGLEAWSFTVRRSDALGPSILVGGRGTTEMCVLRLPLDASTGLACDPMTEPATVMSRASGVHVIDVTGDDVPERFVFDPHDRGPAEPGLADHLALNPERPTWTPVPSLPTRP
jgi:hypothetical protein